MMTTPQQEPEHIHYTIERRLLAGEEPKAIAESLGLVYDASEDAVVRPGWLTGDGHAEVEYPDAGSADDAVREHVSDCWWGEHSSTFWVPVWVWQIGLCLDDGKVVEIQCGRERHIAEIEPEEPECSGDEHDWRRAHRVVGGVKENPGVHGHGGGVIITEHCRNCGCYRVTDTWAQDPSDGREGLRSVEYKAADSASLAYVASEDLGERESR